MAKKLLIVEDDPIIATDMELFFPIADLMLWQWRTM